MNTFINKIDKSLNGDIFKEVNEWLKKDVKNFSHLISINASSEAREGLTFDNLAIFEIIFRIRPDIKSEKGEDDTCWCKIHCRRNTDYYGIDFRNDQGIYKGTVYSEKELFERIEKLFNEFLEYLKQENEEYLQYLKEMEFEENE